MSAEADALCGAEYGASSPERVNVRNGYRQRELDTRTGTLEVAIPKLRSGSYFPDWFLERRRRSEAALTSAARAPPTWTSIASTRAPPPPERPTRAAGTAPGVGK
jgi:hypothetical protein